MSTQLSRRAFNGLADLFQQASGIRLSEAKASLVTARLQRLATDYGEADVERFVQRVVAGEVPAAAVTQTVDRLTTNETYFFRERQHFDHLAARAAAHDRRREFRVWSAASSSGEEAYTIAMVLAEALGRAPWRVIGTDLSTAMVRDAQRALYPMERAQNVPPTLLKKWCLKGTGEHAGHLLMARELRERVSFECANLMQPLPELPDFDVIFLRNVLIYFDADAKAAIVGRVIERLRPDGVLYTGHAESLTMLNLPLKMQAMAVYARAPA